jgi:DNA processing protein
MDSPEHLLRLLRAVGNGGLLRQALSTLPADALCSDPGYWRGRVEAGRLQRLLRPDPAALGRDLAWLQGPGRRLLHWRDVDYPALLRQAPNPPPVLFVEGDAGLLWRPQIAVVGSRRPSTGGEEHAARFAMAFASSGWVVSSGLASGVDGSAHRAALTCGRTLAVIGTGPDRVFPTGHAALAARIAAEGAVVSEHPPGTAARAGHFPARNRILAGLALGTVVVEAAERSGALITARLAADAGREVFALPGSIDNPQARGCHRLIRDGAMLVESPAEVLEALAPLARSMGEFLSALPQTASRTDGEPAERARPAPAERGLWRALGHDPASVDQLAERSGLTVAVLSPMLQSMELRGLVACEFGRWSRRGSLSATVRGTG